MKIHSKIVNRTKLNSLTGCLEWAKGKHGYGYGLLCAFGEVLAHRVSFILYKGPIPEGAFICHKCDNPCCVNPDHLFLGTPKDNTMDMHSKGRDRNQNVFKSHCKRGHEFTKDNTYFNNGKRACKTCILKRDEDKRLLRREKEGFKASNKSKTHCINGHAFTKENTYIRKRNGDGRICKTCCIKRSLERYYKNKDA